MLTTQLFARVDIVGVDILGVDISGVGILGVEITPSHYPITHYSTSHSPSSSLVYQGVVATPPGEICSSLLFGVHLDP